MKVRKAMTEEVRNKIKLYIKEGVDISSVIENYSLKNEHLAGAIIKNLDRLQEDISNCNFVNCVIGEEGKVTNLSGSNLKGSNFQSAKFLGTIWFRGADLRNCNFNNAWIPNVDYQYADLRNVSLCETTIKIGSKSGLHAKFSWKLFKLLAKYLQMDMQDE